jgi:proteasome accessory factor A
LIERGLAPKEAAVDQPVPALHRVSRDTLLRQPIRLADGKALPPVDHQRLYLAAARRAFIDDDEEIRWILNSWEEVLDGLESDPMSLSDRLDWVAKKWLLETFMDAEKVGWSDPRLTGLDLEYHNIDPARGLFLGLEAERGMRRVASDEAIETAMNQPPLDTRAGIRGYCVQRFLDEIERIQWERVAFRGERILSLDRLFDPDEVREKIERVRRCRNLDELFLF